MGSYQQTVKTPADADSPALAEECMPHLEHGASDVSMKARLFQDDLKTEMTSCAARAQFKQNRRVAWLH